MNPPSYSSYEKSGGLAMESDYVEVQHSLQGGMNVCNKFEYHIFAAKEVLDTLCGQLKAIYPDAKLDPVKDEPERMRIRSGGDGPKVSRIQIFRLLAKHGFQLRCASTRGYSHDGTNQSAEKWTFVK